jgi:hypothetical protein
MVHSILKASIQGDRDYVYYIILTGQVSLLIPKQLIEPEEEKIDAKVIIFFVI